MTVKFTGLRGSEGIETLPRLRNEIVEKAKAVVLESEAIQKQWRGLKDLGAARDDHAARLLGRLDHPLATLERFVERCREQIAECLDNPFGDKEDNC